MIEAEEKFRCIVGYRRPTGLVEAIERGRETSASTSAKEVPTLVTTQSSAGPPPSMFHIEGGNLPTVGPRRTVGLAIHPTRIPKGYVLPGERFVVPPGRGLIQTSTSVREFPQRRSEDVRMTGRPVTGRV